jgi:hypothetical protein
MLPVTPAAHLQDRFFAAGMVIAVNRSCRFTRSYIHTRRVEIIEIIDFTNWERQTSVLISTCPTGESEPSTRENSPSTVIYSYIFR